jgi:hypothetical protein
MLRMLRPQHPQQRMGAGKPLTVLASAEEA